MLLIRLEEPEWDISTAGKLREALASARREPSVVIDMSNVTYIDSSCLSILMALYQERVIKKHFSAAHLAAPPYTVRRIFEITGLDALWPVHEHIEDAMKAAQAEEAPP
ncbi:MAG TPA: STAS domain-containing protein [Candidatus Cybelea sp.]|jgi:anti-sigma B factor antagonist|nr:STAS domain-containing protein [Candidatus Cybelea sp.]